MDIFNNREIALGIWLLIGAGFALYYKPVRDGVRAVLTALFRRPIVRLMLIIIAYVVLTVALLSWLGLWDVSQLKNTILWTLGVALASAFKLNTISEDENFFRETAKDQLKIITIFEFIVTFYTFPILIELIIIPVSTFLVAMQAFSTGKPEHRPVHQLLDWLLSAMGLVIVIFAGYKLLTDFSTFWQLSTISDFLLPIALSLLYLPFLYCLMLYMEYEGFFRRIEISIKDQELRRSAKWMSLTSFLGRRGLLKRWLRDVQARQPTTREGLVEIEKRVKRVAELEKAPPPVDPEDGWSPYIASRFLIDEDLMPGDYHPDFVDDEWSASTPYLEIGESVLPSNIAYYVYGNERIAHTLKVVLNFNRPDDEVLMRGRFTEVALALIKKALGEEAAQKIESVIAAAEPFEASHQNATLSLSREDWVTDRGYDLRLIVQRGKTNETPTH